MHEPTRDWDKRYIEQDTPWDTDRPSSELARVLAEYTISPCRALELGCGTGTNAVYLAQQGFDMTAVDVSQTAMDQARQKVEAAGAAVALHTVDLVGLPDLGSPFDFVFDRGVYHCVRREHLEGFQATLSKVVAPGGMYLTLAGNANEVWEKEGGPPRVTSEEICREISPLMDLVQLREIRFDQIEINGRRERPLAWSALFRRRP